MEFLLNLLEQTDWELVIKAAVIAEVALGEAIQRVLTPAERERITEKIDQGLRPEIRVARQFDLLSHDECNYLREVSAMRNVAFLNRPRPEIHLQVVSSKACQFCVLYETPWQVGEPAGVRGDANDGCIRDTCCSSSWTSLSGVPGLVDEVAPNETTLIGLPKYRLPADGGQTLASWSLAECITSSLAMNGLTSVRSRPTLPAQ